jgi:DNA invertase Pin-like site-specific DNA recombinase
MSRLARSNADWHRLLELCALFGTLLADLDGVYDPAQYNDRLLLGLKRPVAYSTPYSTLQSGLSRPSRGYR